MSNSRTKLNISLVLVGLFSCFAVGEIAEGGCDLRFTQPCRTNTSLCVPLEHIRDGFLDCPDGSDEDCPDDWFICSDLSRCIAPHLIQDGVQDCDDDSDEACDESQHECLCGLPRCIDKSLVGDGNLDCNEGSDELAIEKTTYICPDDLQTGQELFRKKRQVDNERQRKADKVITNFYSLVPGSSPTLGVIKSTVDSFINRKTTSEYFTKVEGTFIDGQYAQVTSLSSRTFFALPTRLSEQQVKGLVSSYIRTTVSNGYTQTIVSKIYHTIIDGTYAQLVEAETKGGIVPTKTDQSNIVTILQGENLQGTFLSQPDGSLATLQFSHLQGSLNLDPVAAEIVTVTGTYGIFIKDTASKAVTYSVFTGTYVKDHQTYVFFFGNSALPYGSNMNMNPLDNRKVILDMEKTDMKMIMPAAMKMNKMAADNKLFMGEGIVDGRKMDGVFIADSDGFDIKGAHEERKGDIKMMTVTIGQHNTVTDNQPSLSFFDQPTIEDNEVDGSLWKGRKVDFQGDALITDVNDIMPTRPIPSDILPTFVIQEPNQELREIVVRQQIQNENARLFKNNDNLNVVENIKEKFNIDSFIGDSELPRFTYYGFADFTTTIDGTVVIFTPNTRTSDRETIKSLIKPRIIATKVHPKPHLSGFTTSSIKVFNSVDLYPSGLVSSIGGTIINNDKTTLFTTLVYGTYIDGKYAQVVRSVSSIIYLVAKSETPGFSPSNVNDIMMTNSPFFKNDKQVSSINIFDSFFEAVDNNIGRSVNGKQQNINEIISYVTAKNEVTYTTYTTFVRDGSTIISTNYQTSPVTHHISSFATKTLVLPTFTHYTTHHVNGVTNIQSRVEILATNINTQNELLFESNVKTTESTTEVITEPTIIDLQSSLKNEKEVDANFFPRTYYTTYTYFTTYQKHNTSSIVSSLETITNVFNNKDQFQKYKSLSPVVPTYPVTYWTTFTYWSTFTKGNSTMTTSSKETISNVVNLTAKDVAAVTNTILPIKATVPKGPKVTTSVVDTITYYTTYTYYTTTVEGTETVVHSRFVTKSSITSRTMNQAETDLKTGLLSTIRGSTVIGGITTLFSTNVIGSYVDGLYVQIQSTTSEILRTSSSKIGKTVLTVNAGSTIEGDITTHYTTQIIGMYVNGNYVENEVFTTRIEGMNPAITDVNPTKTGIVKEIIGSLIHGTKTTYYQSTVVGTLINNIYAQKVQSTSRFVVGPSISFAPIMTDSFFPLLEPSIATNIKPTPVLVATQSLEESMTDKHKVKKSKNRSSFPIRKSSKRRTDVFPFIRRTSTFNKERALSKVLAVTEEEKTVIKEIPVSSSSTKIKLAPISAHSFRFGNAAPSTRRFRFQGRVKSADRVIQKPVLAPKQVVEEIKEEVVKETKMSQPQNQFRQFRFGSGKITSTTGTRSSLPIRKKKQENISSSTKSDNHFRFGSLPEPTTPEPKTIIKSAGQSKSKRPSPFSFGSNLNDKRKLRQRRPERPKTQRRPAPATTTQRTVSRGNRKPIIRLSSRRRPIIPRHRAEASSHDYVYLQLDGSDTFDDYEFLNYEMDDTNYEEVLSRKRRQVDNFGSRTSSRGIRRFARITSNAELNPEMDDSGALPKRQRFTLINPSEKRAQRGPRRRRIKPRVDVPASQTRRSFNSKVKISVTPRNQEAGKSRTSLPFRTRPNPRVKRPNPAIKRPTPSIKRPTPSMKRPTPSIKRPTPSIKRPTSPTVRFRRPSSHRAEISNRFTIKNNRSNIRTKSRRRPSVNEHRRKKTGSRNPSIDFIRRVKPVPKPATSPVIVISEGKIDIIKDITVTREVSVTTTIPLLENGLTVNKQVITASYVTEVVTSDQITPTEIDGELKLLLSTVLSKQKVTSIFIQPIETTTVIYTAAFIEGKKTSQAHIVPTTIFSIVTVIDSKKNNNVQDLLQLLLLQQQPRNPFLGLQTTRLHTKIFVTSVTSLTSTLIPIIFRGKPIVTTVVETNVIQVTLTEVITQTIQAGSGGSPLEQLLPLLLNRNVREVSQTSMINDKSDFTPDIVSDREERSVYHKETPPLLSIDSFLWDGPAEITPLRRKVRSATRGKQTFQIRNRQGRKINIDSIDQIIQDPIGIEEGKGSSRHKPTTYYTTFTFYTTLIDELDRKYVKSSEETITQVATLGNHKFDDFTRINLKKFLPLGITSVTMQEKFSLTDAIIPGKPRPVPNPIFKEPQPPHGPIVRFEDDQVLRPSLSSSVPNRPQTARIHLRGQKTKILLVNNVSVAPRPREHQIVAKLNKNSSRGRARFTVTKRRPIQIPNTVDIKDSKEENKRVFVERINAESETRATSSPVNSFTATVNELYTVYSYIYSLYKGVTPFSVSTRLLTVSNIVRPTVVHIPNEYQSISATSNLFTIENGATTASIAERIANGITTQLFLSSATLISVKQRIAEHSATRLGDADKKIDVYQTSIVENLNLKSSLIETDSLQIVSTPVISASTSITSQDPIQRTVSSKRPLITSENTEKQTIEKEQIVKKAEDIKTSERGSIRYNSRGRPFSVRKFTGGLSSKRKNLINSRRRRPKLTTSKPIETTVPLERYDYEDILPEVDLVIPASDSGKGIDIFDSVFAEIVVTTNSTIDENEAETTTTVTEIITITSENSVSTPSPIKLPGSSIHRNKLPVQRPTTQEDKIKSPFLQHRLRFTTTEEPITTTNESEDNPEYYYEYYYDDEDIPSTTEESSTVGDTYQPNKKGGRAVLADLARDHFLGSSLPIGTRLSISRRQNLSTKIMDNGVQVIVADDSTSTKHSNRFVFGSPRPTIKNIHRPTTLPASTVTNQMLLLASPPQDREPVMTTTSKRDEFHSQTYYTTFTYFHTKLVNGQPTVVTSRQTTSNVGLASVDIHGNFVEKNKVHLDTSTYLTTQTVTRNVGDLLNPKLVISEEVFTQVVITEAPFVSRFEVQSIYSTMVTKTYFTTYTYYTTYEQGTGTVVETETVVSSDIVTETYTGPNIPVRQDIGMTKSQVTLFNNNLAELFATKTYFTTSTYLTTILQGDQTITKSHIEVTSKIVTETITKNEFLPLSPTEVMSPKDQTRYLPLGGNVYKELRTFFATYTGFQTKANGDIISKDIVSTKVLTMTVTTTSVPESLIVKPTALLSNLENPDKVLFPTGIFNSFFGDGTVQLDPSFTQSSTLQGTTSALPSLESGTLNDMKDPAGLKATVHVEEGSDDATNKVVKDSTTTATLLVKSSEQEEILASTVEQLVTTTTLDFASILRGEDLKITRMTSGASIIIFTDSRGTIMTRILINPTSILPIEVTSSVRIELHSLLFDVEQEEASSTDVDSEGNSKVPSNEASLFPISLNPVFTGMLGLIGNTIAGSLAGEANAARRKSSIPMMPKNAIVAAGQDQLFIPIGGVGESLRNSQEQTLLPEHGFIPLTNPDVQTDFTGIVPLNEGRVQFTERLPAPIRGFPTFRAPLTTEGGFTAMTSNILPTSVSVITGEETIFFEGVHNNEHGVSERLPIFEIDDVQSLIPVPIPTESVKPVLHSNLHEIHTVIDPTIVNIDSRDIVHNTEANLYAGIFSTQLPFRPELDNVTITVITDSVTLVSGQRTIFTSLFPVASTIVDTGPDGKLTSFVTRLESTPIVNSFTKTHYEIINGFPVTITEVQMETKGYRTFVSTIVGLSTRVNILDPSRSLPKELTTVTVGDDSNINTPSTNTNLEYNEIEKISIKPPTRSNYCSPKCTSNQICQSLGNQQLCVCKPGFSRKSPDDMCKRSNSFEVDVTLDRYNFVKELRNKTHPDTQNLMKEVELEIDTAFRNSKLGHQYRSSTVLAFEEMINEQEVKSSSIMARIKVDLAVEEPEKILLLGGTLIPGAGLAVNENSIQSTLEDSFLSTNYTDGENQLFASRHSAILQAKDFDECQSGEFNDCHKNAECLNTEGSFTCKCMEMYTEVYSLENDDSPGRECIESRTCGLCNFHGRCQEDSNKEITCVCNDWFSGEFCEINMKVMLIAVISVGVFLMLTLTIFLIFCCCRSSKRDRPARFLIAGSRGQPSTLDRRAMIHDSSSECSEDVTKASARATASTLPPMPKMPKVDYSIGRQSGISTLNKDRSVTTHTTLPAVLIPRIKGYGSNTVSRTFSLDKETKENPTAEAALVHILDGDQHGHRTQEIDPEIPVHSFRSATKNSREFDDDMRERSRSNSRSRHNHAGTTRSRSSDRLDRSTHDLASDIEAAHSIRYGNRSESQARSFDETTVRPPIRSLRGESFRSRDMSQVLSDGMPTNAERDGNSTIVYPQMQLYRPVREADSMSDLTGNPKNHSNNFFE